MYSIDIDIGGTFTDGFFTDGKDFRSAKVLSTPHDITEGFLACVKAGAQLFDHEPFLFLRRTGVVRLSTTVGTNLLVQRRGARIGLIVTSGFEFTLYGHTPASSLHEVLPADMIRGIREEVDEEGVVRTAPQSEDVLAATRDLIAGGARLIIISLRSAWRNPANERAVRAIIRERYPLHYLRSVPVQIGIEITQAPDDHARTNSALLNGYVHAEMAQALFTAEDKLRGAGYDHPLLVVHANGGNARVAKTIALNTLHSGPAVAVRGAAELARLLGLGDVVTADVGGTSLDVALIRQCQVPFAARPKVKDLPIAVPAVRLDSFGIGGCSIARVRDGELLVGPESAGATPGPACYGKGGAEPTVTDANLILGLIDAEHFLGGRMRLDLAAARRAIERRIARPLGVSVEAAALRIRNRATHLMAQSIRQHLEDVAPGEALAPTLFTSGGAGALHVCDLAQALGVTRAYVFAFGSVFSAFGGNTTDIQHIYDRHFSRAPTLSALADALVELIHAARRDMQAEKAPQDVVQLAATVHGGSAHQGTVEIDAQDEPRDIAARLSSLVPEAAVSQLSISVRAPTPHWQPERHAAERASAEAHAHRLVSWSQEAQTSTPVFDRLSLKPGHILDGPALIDGPDTTYAIASAWRLTVDSHGFFEISFPHPLPEANTDGQSA